MSNLTIIQWEGNISKNKRNVYFFSNQYDWITYVTKNGDDIYKYYVEGASGYEIKSGTCSWNNPKWL